MLIIHKKAVQDGVHDVHDWLMQVRMINELITAKQAERDQLMTLATNITPNMDGMPHATGVSDKIGNAAVKLADMTREIDDLVDQYLDIKQEIIAELEKLPDVEYTVLHKYYVQGKSWGKIATEMAYCRVQIWRIKDKALEHLKHVT